MACIFFVAQNIYFFAAYLLVICIFFICWLFAGYLREYYRIICWLFASYLLVNCRYIFCWLFAGYLLKFNLIDCWLFAGYLLMYALLVNC